MNQQRRSTSCCRSIFIAALLACAMPALANAESSAPQAEETPKMECVTEIAACTNAAEVAYDICRTEPVSKALSKSGNQATCDEAPSKSFRLCLASFEGCVVRFEQAISKAEGVSPADAEGSSKSKRASTTRRTARFYDDEDSDDGADDDCGYFDEGCDVEPESRPQPRPTPRQRQPYAMSSMCATPVGSCPAVTAFPQGSSCYCATAWGPVWGRGR